MEPNIYQLIFRDVVMYFLFVAVAAFFWRQGTMIEQETDKD